MADAVSLSLLKAIFGAMEQGVVFIDDKDRIVYCNPAAERIRDIRLQNVLGHPILEFHPEKSHSKVLEIIEELRSGKVKGHHRMNIQMVDGKYYDNTYSAVSGPRKKYLGVIVVTQEVTEQKRAEEQCQVALRRLESANEELRRLDQVKDNFLSNVSHELKTPMISLMGYLGMLLKERVGALNEEQRRFLDISYKNLLKLSKNIDDLLDLAELGIRKEALALEPTNLSKVIEFSCSTVDPLAKEHDIQLETKLPPHPVTVPGIENKLNQLFDNLLTNAIKYNRPGGKIFVALEEDADCAFIRIADTGIGISPQSIKEVFKRHFREKARSLGNMKGLGIGLSLVEEIVRLHSGDIHLESETDKGTTFTVKIPKR
jgi:two-component system phosphate regulon sensor histidine kinase PhoR